ncbi:uncharacterized protein LAESUDRAFT_726996 [Laetiporus sulphureus 93-53]|uniref:Uncharacterized protein n=1 Tax=Laetiporus sulphureus 93-53 TaxID=1314785 RepID=A0A165DPU1_9APHY|nr:uncharacterized protein LAESUDRAFT_726996 [Laetiporus sulphureus 93-53]KZT05364.1 hypothetical protein LAESUDRAFT_726996 [Laetiporus sulphureus 93-53]
MPDGQLRPDDAAPTVRDVSHPSPSSSVAEPSDLPSNGRIVGLSESSVARVCHNHITAVCMLTNDTTAIPLESPSSDPAPPSYGHRCSEPIMARGSFVLAVVVLGADEQRKGLFRGPLSVVIQAARSGSNAAPFVRARARRRPSSDGPNHRVAGDIIR